MAPKWVAGANEFVSEEGMSLREIGRLLDAEVLSGAEHLDRFVHQAASTDLMSSVLAHAEPGSLLLTTLANIQVINTVEVAGLCGVVFMGGVRPAEAVIRKAALLNLTALLTPHPPYVVCDLLCRPDVGGPA